MWRLSLGEATVAAVVIALGVVFLLSNLDVIETGPGRIWSIIWPLLLVVLGLSLLKGPGRLLFGRWSRRQHWHSGRNRHEGKLVGEVSLGGPGWRLEDQDIELGAGSIHLDLTQAEVPEGETKLRIHGKVGEVEVVVPAALGIAVHAKTGMGEIDLAGKHSEGVHRELEYTSEGYGQAAKRVRMDISLDIGEITVTRGGA